VLASTLISFGGNVVVDGIGGSSVFVGGGGTMVAALVAVGCRNRGLSETPHANKRRYRQ